jgi:hypothetical protein
LVKLFYKTERDKFTDSLNPAGFWIIPIQNPVKPKRYCYSIHDDLEQILMVEVEIVRGIDGNVREDDYPDHV